jgi:cleavage and polyadenylation specificity factor subunit 5
MTTITEIARKTSILPPMPSPFNERQAPTIRLYPVSNYTFGIKDVQPEEDSSVQARLQRLQEQYDTHGMRRTCEAILVCHEHGHPYILMLQIANSFFKLPGDYIQPQQEELEGFKQRLNEKLAPSADSEYPPDPANSEWEIGDCLAQWWRPNFETFMYPFIPPHITRPKECKKMFLVHLPRKKVLCVPKNMKLLAVPLFELYDNSGRYGGQLAAIPLYLSRYNFEFVDSDDNVIASYPAGTLPVHRE